MEIQELKVFDAPNIFSLREIIVRIQIKLGEYAEIPTKDIGKMNESIIRLFPGIKDHKCAKGYIGGFVERLREGTYLAHVTEHLCLETQRMLGYDIKHGKARIVKDDIYNVIFSTVNKEVGKACGLFVINTLNKMIKGQLVDILEEFKELKKICVKNDLAFSTGAIIEEAKRRGIPVSLVNDGEFVRLGYGRYQKSISTGQMYDSTKLVRPLLDMIFPEGTPSAIPIVSVTGTNGKTTTTRMISRILRYQGLVVGTTTTHGIYINDRCIVDGDTTGPKSAKRILNSGEIEAAVLETARGGIIREGLAYEKADVAVFTNLTRDHIGIDGINTMEELLHAKSLVIEAVRDDGTCVMNADDQWVMKAREKAKGNHILFSMDYKNPIIREHVSNGGTAVYKRDGRIFIKSRGAGERYITLRNIPATLDGRLKHNIYNSMAAIGACFALGVPFDTIEEALSGFTCDADVNPGRFNIYDMGEFKVVLDYGHNFDGYQATIEGLVSLNPSRLVGIIGVPGDRLDTDIYNVGKISGSSFDYIIVKEDKDLRGRKPFEVAELLYEGALSGGISGKQIEIISDEREAFGKAFRQVQNGDVIAVFFEKMEPLMELMQRALD